MKIAMNELTISTHVLDLALGHPAKDIVISLEKKSNCTWTCLKKAKTNIDGRIVFQIPAKTGTYRLDFKTKNYLKKTRKECFFVQTPVVFEIQNLSRKYHIPLLLSPFGYSTYRGS